MNSHILTPPLSTNWPAASLAMADFIGSLRLELRQWILLDTLRRDSFGAGKLEAELPPLRQLADDLRISSGNISATLCGLEQALAIERHAGLCAFRFPLARWKIPLRRRETAMGSRTSTNQMLLGFPPANLDEALRDQFLEHCGIGSEVRGQRSEVRGDGAQGTARPTSHEGTGQSPVHPAVPESGTAAPFMPPSSDRSRIGSKPENPMVGGRTSTAPESGADSPCHDREEHECSSMSHGTMVHANESFLEKNFQVGPPGGKTGREILDAIKKCGKLSPKYERHWMRRLGEDAGLVWDLAAEAVQRHDVANKLGWMNTGYMEQKGLGKYARL